MLEAISLRNLGPIAALDWNAGPGLNVMIGANDSGKTLLLKLLYVCVRTAEAYRRGDDVRTLRQLLDEKLTWTFQLPRIGDLVRKGQDDPLHVRVQGKSREAPLVLDFSFGPRARKGVGDVVGELPLLGSTSLFIPAKEVLSLMSAIKESRQALKFGFDDPTYDLVLALEREPSVGTPPFGTARREIERLINGRVLESGGEWTFLRDRKRYPVAITAEGIKKIAILDRLIVNRSLTESSVLFVDEPESFLHPEALVRFLDVLAGLARSGMQIFLATHSVIALRKLVLLAKGEAGPVPLLELERRHGHGPTIHDLREGMPPNALSDASAWLYEQELV
jgi:ABC-type cobalamin/Fe3+-siderophores transport system ATPase subunit